MHDVWNFNSTQFRMVSLGGHYLLLLLMDAEYALTFECLMSTKKSYLLSLYTYYLLSLCDILVDTRRWKFNCYYRILDLRYNEKNLMKTSFSMRSSFLLNRDYCVKCITLCNCLCSFLSCFSASRVRNIVASHVGDFRPCHNVKYHVCCDFLIPSENGFGHFKEQLKRQTRVVLKEKSCLWSCAVQCEN